MNRRLFLSLAPLLIVPEPRRVYSFLNRCDAPVERVIRANLAWNASAYVRLAVSAGASIRAGDLLCVTPDGHVIPATARKAEPILFRSLENA